MDLERLDKILLRQIVAAFGLMDLLLVVDDTLCPKWGRKIYGTSVYFDHVKRPRPGYLWKHNWIVLAAVVKLFRTPVALPFRVRLYRPEKTCPKREFRSRLQIVAEELAKIRALFASMKIDLVADGAYMVIFQKPGGARARRGRGGASGRQALLADLGRRRRTLQQRKHPPARPRRRHSAQDRPLLPGERSPHPPRATASPAPTSPYWIDADSILQTFLWPGMEGRAEGELLASEGGGRVAVHPRGRGPVNSIQ